MPSIKYYVNRLKKMNYQNFFKTIDKVQKVNHRSKLLIFFDMCFSSIIYGAGYTDYYSFGMYDLNSKQKSTILTRGKNNYYVALYNPKEKWHFFDNKNEFNELFSSFLKRKWLYLKDVSLKDLDKWLKGMKEIIAKPNSDSGGHGIEKLSVKDFKTTKELYDYLINKKLYLLEEVVIQHKDLSKVYSKSVNTIRIITIFKDEKVNYITAFLRIGNNGFLDNTSSGGMLTMIDLEKGITLFPACDASMNIYYEHPFSKEKIKGIKIPYFKEAKSEVARACQVIPEIKYIAWDVAITDKGPLIIEGNPYPGYYYQFPIHTLNKCGILPKFKEIEKSDKK